MKTRTWYAALGVVMALALCCAGCKHDTESESSGGESTQGTENAQGTESTSETEPSDAPEDSMEVEVTGFTTIGETVTIPSGTSAEELIAKIYGLTEDTTIKLSGPINAITLNSLSLALSQNDSVSIALDMSETTGIKEIKADYFKGLSNLYSIKLPDTVTAIAAKAFENCTTLVSVDFPSSLVSIGEMAFFSCKSLTEVSIPDTVTALGASVFGWCTSLETAVLGSGISEAKNPFFNCDSLKTLCIRGSLQNLTGSFESVETLVIDGTIPYGMFRENENLKTVQLGSKCLSIGEEAFRDCSSLETVTGAEAVEEIGAYAFQGCKALKSISSLTSITSIGSKAFENCEKLTSISLGDKLQVVPYCCFYNATALSSVKFGKSITEIAPSAFYSCPLTSITLPEGIETIGERAFYSCPITSLILPEGTKTIGNSAFGSTAITDLDIPMNVTKIGDAAFSECTELKKLLLHPADLSRLTIGDYAFSRCSALQTINVKQNDEESTRSVGTITIGKDAFRFCTSLISADFREISKLYNKSCGNKIQIGEEAFLSCSALQTVKIPAQGAQKIEKNAFYLCKNLSSVLLEDDGSSGYSWYYNTSGVTSNGTKFDFSDSSANAKRFTDSVTAKYAYYSSFHN